MSNKKRSRSKNHHNGFIKKVGLATFVVMTVALTTLLIHLFVIGEEVVSSEIPIKMNLVEHEDSNDISNAKIKELDSSDITQIEDASSEINGEWRGVCKKNSIHSVEDFRRTVQDDAVLANHFSGFNWETAKLGKLDEEIFVFVSHRKGDVIKETSKPIRLPKGDGYITDGVRKARTYCCNDITITPSAGVPEKDLPSAPLSSSVPLEETPLNEIVVPSTRTTHSFNDPITKPTPEPIPEPGTILLTGTGLVVLAAVCRKKKLRKQA